MIKIDNINIWISLLPRLRKGKNDIKKTKATDPDSFKKFCNLEFDFGFKQYFFNKKTK